MAAGLQTRVEKSDAVKRIDISTLSILCSDAPDAPGHSTQYSCLSEVASSEYLGIKDSSQSLLASGTQLADFLSPGGREAPVQTGASSRMDQNVGFPTFSDNIFDMSCYHQGAV